MTIYRVSMTARTLDLANFAGRWVALDETHVVLRHAATLAGLLAVLDSEGLFGREICRAPGVEDPIDFGRPSVSTSEALTDSAGSGLAASAPIGSSALCSIRLNVASALRSPLRFGLSGAIDLVESFSKQIALTPRSG